MLAMLYASDYPAQHDMRESGIGSGDKTFHGQKRHPNEAHLSQHGWTEKPTVSLKKSTSAPKPYGLTLTLFATTIYAVGKKYFTCQCLITFISQEHR